MQHAMYAVEALSGFVGGAVKGFFKGPPAIYDPTVHTMRGWQKKFQEVWLKEGFGAAYNNLRMMTVMRTGGVLVGQDHLGNRYFENKDAPYGAGAQELEPVPPTRHADAARQAPPPPPRLRRPYALVRDANSLWRVGHRGQVRRLHGACTTPLPPPPLGTAALPRWAVCCPRGSRLTRTLRSCRSRPSGTAG
jgi:hypothetical protein